MVGWERQIRREDFELYMSLLTKAVPVLTVLYFEKLLVIFGLKKCFIV